MLTSIGRFLRKLRIDQGEILKDMAEKLGVTVSFLSSVENGKKKCPRCGIRRFAICITSVQIREMLLLQQSQIQRIALK